jgi:site-specific DNA-adenine methylase
MHSSYPEDLIALDWNTLVTAEVLYYASSLFLNPRYSLKKKDKDPTKIKSVYRYFNVKTITGQGKINKYSELNGSACDSLVGLFRDRSFYSQPLIQIK